MNDHQPDNLGQPGLLDGILVHEDMLVPSSGFAALVMEAIHEQAVAPAPIPFPWKLALPGLAALIAALVIIVRLAVSAVHTMHSGADFLPQSRFEFVPSTLMRTQAGPALLGLMVALVCTLVCYRLGVRSAR